MLNRPNDFILKDHADKIGDLLSDSQSRAINVLYPPAPLVGAKGDGVTNDRQAIQNIGNSVPVGGKLIFPPTENGYYLKNITGSDTELLLFTKPINLIGFGYYSHLVVDDTVPTTCDVIRISPNMAYGSDMYAVEGMCIHNKTNGVRSARHALHLDISQSGQNLSRMSIRRNIFYSTGGWSIYLSNPINTDGFYTSQIENNRLSGGISLIRGGDSLTITGNTITGYNGVDISLVDGSNTTVLAFNNITARGGVRIRRGHNIKVMYNNLEVAYADMTLANNAFLDIDGSDQPTGTRLWSVDVVGNNLTYRSTATNVVDGIRVGLSMRCLIENNYLTHNGGRMIHVTSNAYNAEIGYNLYSYPNPEGNILDEGVSTVRRNVHRDTPATGHELWDIIANDVNREGFNRLEKFDNHYTEGRHATNPAYHRFVYPETITGNIKHTFLTQRRTSAGSLDSQAEVMYIDFEKVRFPSVGYGMYTEDGQVKKVQHRTALPTTGTYNKGDIVYNANPAKGGYIGWSRLTTGSNHILGTDWQPFGLIQA